MTLSLTHPVTGLTAAATAAVEAAQDSMAYWQAPKAPARAKAEQPAPRPTAALDQMYAYFG